AAERGISVEEVAMQTTANFYRLFSAAAPDASAELRETLRGAGLLG
ncbi:MAG: hydrolase TatD, partial [Pseudomonadota bacterium]